MSFQFLLDAFTIFCAGLLVGNEVAIAVFIHPTLARLPDREHAAAAKPIAAILGRVMPFPYALVGVLLVAETWLAWTTHPRAATWFGVAAVLWMLVVIATVLVLAPLNGKIATWNLQDLPATWKEQRRQWDALHRVRVTVLCVAFVCLLVAVHALWSQV